MHPGRALLLSTNPKTARAKLAAATRHHPDEDHTNLQRELAAAKLESYVARIVAEAPPLTPEQLDRVSALLRAGRAA